MKVSLGGIPFWNSPKSPSRDLAWQWSEGKRPKHEIMTEISRLVAENIRDYRANLYPSMSPQVQDYVRGRVTENRPYDLTLARALGRWVIEAFTARSENDHTIEIFLLPATEYCQKAGLLDYARRISEKIEQIQALQFPYQLFRDAMRVKALDARDREHQKR